MQLQAGSWCVGCERRRPACEKKERKEGEVLGDKEGGEKQLD